MKSCVYPGSFDPITKGHMDIIQRASRIFETVYVAVLNNSSKNCMFSVQKRVDMIKMATKHIENVEVLSFEGMLVDLLHKADSKIILRGLRTSMDLELEQQTSVINQNLDHEIETIALLSRPQTHFISSTAVRELLRFGADITEYVPHTILEIINGGKTI
ncbi:MAG: pantetheine-phosphate adenylyltransferase [Christensenellaceae bacterium]